MKRNILRKTLCAALVCVMALCFTAADGGLFTVKTAKADAAAGIWKLTGTKYYVPRDKTDYEFMEPVIQDNTLMLRVYGGFHDTAHDKKAVGNFDAYCTVPAESYKSGEKAVLQLKMDLNNTVIQENVSIEGSCCARLDDPGTTLFFGVPAYGQFESEDGRKRVSRDMYYTGPGVDEMTAYYTWPEESVNGETRSIYCVNSTAADSENGWLYYEWTYTFVAGGGSTQPEEPQNPEQPVVQPEEPEGEEEVIAVGQVKNVKLSNKKGRYIYISFKLLKDVDGYEIQYGTKKNMKGAKTIPTVSGGYFVDKNGKKVAFKKGKTYYARVRAYKLNSKGDKVYGKWSSVKSVKIKK